MKNIDHDFFVIAGCKPWNRRVHDEIIRNYPGKWFFAGNPQQLDDLLIDLKPRYIFFIHWSWIVPSRIINKYECVCFHMSDVPYGRGGSPLQNLIIRGHHETKLTALRMTKELDAGPVYLKESLSLDGNAEEIYIRASYLSMHMIQYIIKNNPEPLLQKGKSVIFKRRKPAESKIKKKASLQALFNFLRMLDAEDYPHAYLEHKGFRYEFRRAALYNGHIIADVTVTMTKDGKHE